MNKKSALQHLLDGKILYNEMCPNNKFYYSNRRGEFRTRYLRGQEKSRSVDVSAMAEDGWATEPPEECYKVGAVLNIAKEHPSTKTIYARVTVTQVGMDTMMLIGLTGNRFTDKVVKLNQDGSAPESIIKYAAEGSENTVYVNKLADSLEEYYSQYFNT